MPGKIFINYRRDDDPAFAARVRDGLATKFGKTNLFMDVDNLLAGRRFDQELAKALAACDVLIAIMGNRWMDQLKARMPTGERDYVGEEIAETCSVQLRPYFKVIASPLRSKFAKRPSSLPLSSSTAPFWLVKTIARAPEPTASPAPAAP